MFSLNNKNKQFNMGINLKQININHISLHIWCIIFIAHLENLKKQHEIPKVNRLQSAILKFKQNFCLSK